MNRAILLQEALVEGLKNTGQVAEAHLVEQATFVQDPNSGRVLVGYPRRRLAVDIMASDDEVLKLRTAIDEGAKASAFYDAVIIIP